MAKRNKKRRVMGDINVVPYIDVMLVLLVIFMATATAALTQGVEVELPKADSQTIEEELLDGKDPLVLSINSVGEMFLNIGANENEPLAEVEVQNRAAKVIGVNPTIPVLVRADHRVSHGDVVAGMVLLQNAGASKVGFITDPPERLNNL